jgi:DMSO/TMAO reductase YedYZ molybdopterin-dependent catalytic subunit
VVETARDPDWRLTVAGAHAEKTFTRAELARLPQSEAVLPIACVEGWSTTASWRGVRLRDLLDSVAADPSRTIRVSSLQTHGPFRATTMPPEYARDPLTLVALEVNGAPLDIDHGYPARIIAPGRPGVLQTKWLSELREEPS